MSGITQIFRPPIDQRLIDTNGMMTDAWQSWFITFYQSLITTIQTNFIKLPLINATQLASIINPTDGLMAFNTTTSQPIISIGGTFRNILHT